MGYRPLRRLLTVELPIAIPVIGAGLRVAAVSNVSLASVAAVIGVAQLGSLFTEGFQLDFFTPIIVGIVLCLLLAVVFDLIIVTSVRLATPVGQGGADMTGVLDLPVRSGQLVRPATGSGTGCSSTWSTRSSRWRSPR